MGINSYTLYANFEGNQVKIQLNDPSSKNNSSTLVLFQGRQYSVQISGLNQEMQAAVLAILSDPKTTLENLKTKLQSRNLNITQVEEKTSDISKKALPQKKDDDDEDMMIDLDFSEPVEPKDLLLSVPKFSLDAGMAPQKTSDQLHTREVFDLAKAELLNGTLIKSRTTENDLDIFIFNKRSYLVWNSGPKKGHIYRVLIKEEMRSFNPLSQDEFKRLLKELIKMPDPQQSDTLKRFQKCALDLFESKHGDYYLWDAQYFAFPGQDESVIDLFVEIQKSGLSDWVQDQKCCKNLQINRSKTTFLFKFLK